MACATGALTPPWPALIAGVLAAILDDRRNTKALQIGLDAGGVIVSGVLSLPPLGPAVLAGGATAMAVLGLAVDRAYARAPLSLRIGLPTAAASLLLAAFLHSRDSRRFVADLIIHVSPHVGLSPRWAPAAERVALSTGAIAWLERPGGVGPRPGALLFHGAHWLGSHQHAAIIIRRALLDAGFTVLSVDHPGYGASPVPDLDADVDGWDPLPTAVAALQRLRSQADVEAVVVLGHSMGSGDVLRLLAADVEGSADADAVRGAVLLGALLHTRQSRDEYWYGRFHDDRQLRDRLSPERVKEIRARYYDNDRLVRTLAPSHAPILFVRFGREHAAVVATRDALYDLLPGAKATWDLDCSHYFNSAEGLRLVVGDTRCGQRLAARLSLLAGGSPDAR